MPTPPQPSLPSGAISSCPFCGGDIEIRAQRQLNAVDVVGVLFVGGLVAGLPFHSTMGLQWATRLLCRLTGFGGTV